MGLGHMRRNLLLAQALRHSRLQAVVLMIAGAREASLLTSTAGVDCVALPSLWKDGGGQYHPRHLAVSLEELLALRGRPAGAVAVPEPRQGILAGAGGSQRPGRPAQTPPARRRRFSPAGPRALPKTPQ